MADFLPNKDSEFDTWVIHFVGLVATTPTAYGETVGTATALGTAFDAWTNTYALHVTAQNNAKGALGNKDAARASLTDLIRPMVARMQVSTAVDDAERSSLGIRVRSTDRVEAGVPETIPVLLVHTNDRLRHVIEFADATTPLSKAKPDGISGVEIWIKEGGTPPVDASECVYVATDTRTPYTLNFSGDQAGHTVHYMARWVNTRHEPGPWGATVSATVTA